MKKWFKGINTLEELKAAYKKLAMQYHPDRGGDIEIMKEINGEYDMLSKVLPKARRNQEGTAEEQEEERQNDINNAEKFKDVIMAIIHLEGLEIEVCGNWVWVSGDTKTWKDELKKAGFYWASKKQMWYWRAEEYKRKSRRTVSMEDIRSKYGSERIQTSYRQALTA